MPYSWKNPPGFFDLADCPEWLLHLCIKKPQLLQGASKAWDPMAGTIAGTPWAEAALKDELARILAAPDGNRNATLNRAAFSLGQIIAGGMLDEARVVSRLTGAAQSSGLDASETAATIASGLAAGMATPRRPQEGQRPQGGGRAATSDGTARPNAEADFDLSQDALASDMGAQGWDQDARHVALWNKWLFWTGTHWQRDDRLDHMTRTRAYLRGRAESVLEWAEGKAAKIGADEGDGKGDKLRTWAKEQARILRHKNTIAAIESLARSNAALVASAGDFDKNRLLLGTPGGTVDLRTGKLREARRDDMLTMQTAIAPATGTPSLWLAFLQEIFAGDVELIAFMQRAAGYALTGETREHKLLFLYGTGRNGKSVFLNTLFHIWGDYARRAHAATFLNSMGDKHPTDLAGLQGARLVAGSELPKGKTWDESVIKDLTGGDVLTARYMRGDFFDFDPQLTLFIAGNNMPSFRGVDEAIRARVVLVPFTVTIPPERRDTHLADKLKAEAAQILQWAIEGALQWQARGLDVPASVAAASAEYFDDEDIVGQFLGDETAPMPGAFLSAKDLHYRFTQWAEAQKLNTWTQQTIVKEIGARGFDRAKSNGQRGLRGLNLT
jgi:putative DNA primase/helicase